MEVHIASPTTNTKTTYPICFSHLGKHGATPVTLFATTLAIRRQWLTKIQAQQEALTLRSKVYDTHMISHTFFSTFNRVRCLATFGKPNDCFAAES